MDVSKMNVGDVLYDVHREKMGRTDASREGCWEVRVKAVGKDERGHWADLSWNGNRVRRQYHRTKYKSAPKEWLNGYKCYMCNGKKDSGHKPHCRHPRAVKALRIAASAAACEALAKLGVECSDKGAKGVLVDPEWLMTILSEGQGS